MMSKRRASKTKALSAQAAGKTTSRSTRETKKALVELTNPSNAIKNEQNKKFKCPDPACAKSFPYESALISHSRIHTGEKPFGCDECDASFAEKGSLVRHKRVHSGAKPYICRYCKKGFTQSGGLRTHERRHTGEKPFVCSYCSKAFPEGVMLSRHIRIHTGEKPYQCDMCQKKFSQKSNLKVHLRTVHDPSKGTWPTTSTPSSAPSSPSPSTNSVAGVISSSNSSPSSTVNNSPLKNLSSADTGKQHYKSASQKLALSMSGKKIANRPIPTLLKRAQSHDDLVTAVSALTELHTEKIGGSPVKMSTRRSAKRKLGALEPPPSSNFRNPGTPRLAQYEKLTSDEGPDAEALLLNINEEEVAFEPSQSICETTEEDGTKEAVPPTTSESWSSSSSSSSASSSTSTPIASPKKSSPFNSNLVGGIPRALTSNKRFNANTPTNTTNNDNDNDYTTTNTATTNNNNHNNNNTNNNNTTTTITTTSTPVPDGIAHNQTHTIQPHTDLQHQHPLHPNTPSKSLVCRESTMQTELELKTLGKAMKKRSPKVAKKQRLLRRTKAHEQRSISSLAKHALTVRDSTLDTEAVLSGIFEGVATAATATAATTTSRLIPTPSSTTTETPPTLILDPPTLGIRTPVLHLDDDEMQTALFAATPTPLTIPGTTTPLTTMLTTTTTTTASVTDEAFAVLAKEIATSSVGFNVPTATPRMLLRHRTLTLRDSTISTATVLADLVSATSDNMTLPQPPVVTLPQPPLAGAQTTVQPMLPTLD